MSDHDETNEGPTKNQHRPDEGPEKTSIVARLKQLYEERPAVFAVLVMGTSGLVFLLGGVLSGGVDLSSIFAPPMGDMP